MKLYHVFPILLMFLFTLCCSLCTTLESAEQLGASIPIVNSMCPVLTDEEIDEELTVDYKGQRIGLCCRKCVRKFKADPEKYMPDLIITTFPTVRTADTADTNSTGKSQHAGQDDHRAPVLGSEDAEHTEAGHAHNGGGHVGSEQGANEHGGENHEHGESFFSVIGGFHVIAIHFPIALLLTAALIGLANLYFKKSILLSTAIIQTHVGSISSIGTTLLGWSTWMEANYPGSADILWWHQWLGTTTCLCALMTSYAAGKTLTQPRHQRLWLSLLVLTAILVSITGHLGGTLIYG